MMRRWILVGVVFAAGVSVRSGFGGGGVVDPSVVRRALQQDQELRQQAQRMDEIGNQVVAAMVNAGEDGQAFMQSISQQMWDGTLDVAGTEQALVDKGYMTQAMVQQVQETLVQMQAGTQRVFANATYERIRQLLSPTDQEWAILQPKVKRILDAQAEVAQGGETVNRGNSVLGIGGALGGGAMPPGMYFVSQMGGPQGSDTEVGKAWKALQVALEDKNVADVKLKEKLDAWRVLHEKARAELAAAQKDLQEVLTLRQEAVMMIVGVL